MSREFASGSSQFITALNMPISAYPFSMACWFRLTVAPSVGATTHLLGLLRDVAASGNFNRLATFNDSGTLRLRVAAFLTGFGTDNLDAGGSITLNQWHHAVCVFAAADDRTIYLDGGNSASSAVSKDNVATLDRISIGAVKRGAEEASFHDGDIAEAALYDVALTAADAASLAKAFVPPMIRPSGAVFWLPMVRDDDEDLIGGISLSTSGGPTVSAHPRMFYHKAHDFEPLSTEFSGKGSLRGRHRVINPYSEALRGRHKAAIDEFEQSLRGRHRVVNALAQSARGRHIVNFGGSQSLRGRHVISTLVGVNFKQSLRGIHSIHQTYSQSLKARNRLANDAIDLFELFIRADVEPDLTTAPTETFVSLPHTTAPLTPPTSGTRKYFLVLRKRNQYNLSSENIAFWTVTIDSAGVEVVVAPSAPAEYAVAPAEAIKANVTAEYFYLPDGDNQADTWAIFLTKDGINPDPTDIATQTVTMQKVDGLAKLDVDLGPFLEGDPIKVIVATRRGSVQSTNVEIVETIATGIGPAKPDADIHLGDQAGISSTEGDNHG